MSVPFWVGFVGLPAAAVLGAITVLVVLLRLVFAIIGRRPQRYFRPYFKSFLLLVPLAVFVLGPIIPAFLVTRRHHTRSDESYYSGPTVDASGTWIVAKRLHGREVPPADATSDTNPYALALSARDGVRLRGYLVPPRSGVTPRAVAVLVHGLFRGGLEIEPVGVMFRDLGATVVLLELRNHGRSDSAVSAFGSTERLDVLGAIDHVRSIEGLKSLPLVVFGVSLGSAAVAMAMPEVSPPPAAVVLDSPMASLESATDRLLGERIGMPAIFRGGLKLSLEIVGGFRFAETIPVRAIERLDPTVRLLVVGGEKDVMMPPDDVREIHRRSPARDKRMWIVPGASHGKSWEVAPEEYRARLAELMDSISN